MTNILSELTAFLFKEQDAPCSAETHLNTALYAVIETLSQEELDLLPVEGSGADAIVEHHLLFGCPERYNRFVNHYLEKYNLHG